MPPIGGHCYQTPPDPTSYVASMSMLGLDTLPPGEPDVNRERDRPFLEGREGGGGGGGGEGGNDGGTTGWKLAGGRGVINMSATLEGMGLVSHLFHLTTSPRKKSSTGLLPRGGRKIRCPRAETLAMMQSVLNSSTHLKNFPVPLSPELAEFVAARQDAYIPRHSVTDVRVLWPG